MAKQIISKADFVQGISTDEDALYDYITGLEIPNTPENREAKVPFERRLIEEYGYKKSDMEPEFRITKGSALIGPADIVVFHPNAPHNEENIFLIVECKRKERTDGIKQLKSYLAPCKKAQWGVWFNGNNIAYLRVTDEGYKQGFNIPKFGEVLGLLRKEDLAEATELIKVFGIVHNHIYANDGLSSQQAFGEVLKLLFVKIEDEKDVADPMVKFGITQEEYDQIMQGEDNGFRDRIEKLFENVKRSYKDVFVESERINLKTSTLAFVVGQLQGFDLRHSNRDVKGAAFQKFVYAHQRGERGQFFTPDPAIELIVQFLKPKSTETLFDPAGGTGGFLVRGMKYVWSHAFNRIKNERDKAKAEIEYAHNHIRGIERDPTLAKVSKMRMILEDDGYTGIISTDSLYAWEELVKTAQEQGRADIGRNCADVLMTNPPFGNKGKVTDKSILETFDLGYKWIEHEDGTWEKTNEVMNAQVPDILFIERSLDLLKTTGRMGIVLPEGDFSNATLGYVRQYIKERAQILAIVALTPDTFIPHGTGISASILFVQKLTKAELEKLKKKDYNIFFANVEKVGYEGDKHGTIMYKHDQHGNIVVTDTGEQVIDEDITEIVEMWELFQAGKPIPRTDKTFTIKFSELESRLDTQFYRPEYLDLIDDLKGKFSTSHLREIAPDITTGSQQDNFDDEKTASIPFYSIKDIKNLTLSNDEVRWCKATDATKILQRNDIVVAVTGATIGKSAIYVSDAPASYSGDLARIRVKDGVNPYYVLYFLDSPAGQKQIHRVKYGATNKHLAPEALGDLIVPELTAEPKVESAMKESIYLTVEAEAKTGQVREQIVGYLASGTKRKKK